MPNKMALIYDYLRRWDDFQRPDYDRILKAVESFKEAVAIPDVIVRHDRAVQAFVGMPVRVDHLPNETIRLIFPRADKALEFKLGRDFEWQTRELSRFANGTYTKLVWERETWWRMATDIWAEHFAHIAVADPLMLAYTESEDKGERDIQTRCKPGRYLKKFFRDFLTDKQIAYYAAWQLTGTRESPWDKLEVQFARTEDEITGVYASGPDSCMSGFADWDKHPCSIYAAGDLAVAYLKNEPGKPGTPVLARALCWPDRKVFGRVYPTPECWSEDSFESRSESELAGDTLRDKLKALGWASFREGLATFNGARLLRTERRGSYLMPYLDGNYGVKRRQEGGFWIMTNDRLEMGTLCDYTCGYIDDDSGELEEPEEPYAVCGNCHNDIESSDDACSVWIDAFRRTSETWCEFCADNDAFTCAGSGEVYSHENIESVTIDGDTYCTEWAEANGAYLSTWSNEWFWGRDNPSIISPDGTVYATSEAEDYAKLHNLRDSPTIESEAQLVLEGIPS